MIDRRQFVTTATAIATSLWSSRGWSLQPSLTDLGLAEVAQFIRQRSVSPVELTQACLERIETHNPVLNAFVTITAEQALTIARVREQELAQGEYRGPLHGIPIGLKDNIDTAGIRTTAAARALAERIPDTDAVVVQRLKTAGAVVLGKLNMDECALGVSTTTGIFGATHNPWQLDYSPGGSSGGPAAAVAARLCYGAGHRYRRFDPPAGGLVWCGGFEAELRTRERARRDSVVMVAGSRRSDCPQCGRCSDSVASHGRSCQCAG